MQARKQVPPGRPAREWFRRPTYTPEQLRVMRDRLQATIEGIQAVLIEGDLPRLDLDTLWAARRVLTRYEDRIRSLQQAGAR